MRPIKTIYTNKVLGAPPGQEDVVNAAPVTIMEDRIMMVWQPTMEERLKIMDGENIVMFVMGHSFIPTSLEVLPIESIK